MHTESQETEAALLKAPRRGEGAGTFSQMESRHANSPAPKSQEKRLRLEMPQPRYNIPDHPDAERTAA